MIIKPENLELRDKIMTGIDKAFHNLVTKCAANDEALVVADKNGNVKHVPAKELLKMVSK